MSDPVKRFRPKPFWQDGAPSRGGLSYRLAGNEQMFERHAVAWPPEHPDAQAKPRRKA